MSVLFSAKGLHKSFGGVRAVRDVSFEVAAGVVFAIIGPNGAGKSTMLNLMSGVYQPDAGSLNFAGNDLSGEKLGSQLIVDTRVSYQLRQLELYLGVSDLNDKRYEEQPGFPLPGRTYFGGVSLRLWE